LYIVLHASVIKLIDCEIKVHSKYLLPLSTIFQLCPGVRGIRCILKKKITDKHDLHKVVLSTPHQRQKSNSQYFSGDLGTECIDDNPMATVAAEEICKTFIQRVILCCFISFNLSDIFTGT